MRRSSAANNRRPSTTAAATNKASFSLTSKSLLRKVDEHISGLSFHDEDGDDGDDRQREDQSTLEEEHDLLEFVKLVCPHWSRPRRRGRSDAHRAVKKLKAIGVKDTSDLCRRVADNTVNEELQAAGLPKFSKDTLDAIRKQGIFQRSLDTLKEPLHFRQTGNFAPVLQMFSKVNLRQRALGRPESPVRAAHKASNPAWNPTVLPGRSPDPNRVRSDTDDDRPATTTAVSLDVMSDPYLAMRSAGPAGGLSEFSTYSLRSHNSTDDHRRPIGGASLRYNVQHPRKHLRTPDGSRLMTSSSLPATSMSGTLMTGSVQDRPSTVMHINWAEIGAGQVDTGAASDATSGPSGQPSRDRASTDFSGVTAGRGDEAHPEDVDQDLSQVQKWWAKPSRRERTLPKWTSMKKGKDSLLHHSEAMLAEQDQLEQMQRLRRLMEAEGDRSPMRAFVVESIKVRVEEEAEHDLQSAIDTQQRCMNIRKTMSSMLNARRELSTLKSRMAAVIGDDTDHAHHGEGGLPPVSVAGRYHQSDSSSHLTA
mmetsp:Transcript_47933/g.113939  ORF Transcript_47933/g.113939 Transcript_47933/m.113939 type:complete len:535 (-) Transcript_47933:267-1871(-)